jgi:hypothetical protein
MLVDGYVTAGRSNQKRRVLSEERRIFKTTYPELKIAMPNVVVGKIVRGKRSPAGIGESSFHAEGSVLLKKLIFGILT